MKQAGILAALILSIALWNVSIAPAGESALIVLRVEQAIVEKDGLFVFQPDVQLTFALAQPRDVTITIGRHLAQEGRQTAYLAEPILVKTIKLGQLPAGQSLGTGSMRYLAAGCFRKRTGLQ